MRAVRRYANFRGDFPDDWIWNSDETETFQTGGKAIAEAIAEILKGQGCKIENLEDHVEHCWECSFSYEGLKLTFSVVDAGPAILILDEPFGARWSYDLYRRLLIKLDEQLRRDGRFHDLVWHAYDGRRIGKQAFASPVDDEVPPTKQSKGERGLLARLLASMKSRPEAR